MPLPSGKASREQLDKLDEDLHEHQSDWAGTVDEVHEVLEEYKLSKHPEDLQALIAYEADIHKFNVDLQEYFKDEMDIRQQIQSVAIEGLTEAEKAAETIQKELDTRSTQAEKSKDLLRALLVKYPLVSLDLDQDEIFGYELHDATNTRIQELTSQVDELSARRIGDLQQIHAELREELKIEHLEDRFQGYCALAEIKVTQAMGERQRLQEELDRLKASKSKTNKSLTAERKKTEASNKKLADAEVRLAGAEARLAGAEARLAGAEARLAGAEDGQKEQLVLLRELNETRKGSINMMKASLDEKDAKIRGLESDMRSLKAAQEESQARATAAIDERDSRIQDLDVAATEYKAAQGQSDATIARQARELQFATATINARDTRIRDLESAAEEHSRNAQSLNNQLTEFQASIKAKNEELAHLRLTIKDKDQDMATLQFTVDDQRSLQTADDEAASRRQLLLEKNNEIATLKSEAASMRQLHRDEVTAKDAEITTRKRTLRSAIGMMVPLLSDSTSILADDYVAPRLEKMFLDTSDIDKTIPVNHVALPSLRVSDVAQKSSTSHILCLFMAVYGSRNSGEINRHAQGVLDAAQQLGHMKDWIKVIVLQMIQRSQGEDNGQRRILWIIAMQYVLLFSSLVPGDHWLVDAANQVNAAVDQTSSPALRFMIGQLHSSLANAQTNGIFAWLSGYHAGDDQLDDSNSALPQGTRLIGEAPDLFFVVNTSGLTVFTADDVQTVSLDMQPAKNWEFKLIFKQNASVRLDPIILSMNVNMGPPFHPTVLSLIMSSTTEQIKRLEERIAEFKAVLEWLQAAVTTVQAPLALKGLDTLLTEVGKDDAASKAVAELTVQLKAKEHELQKREAELKAKEHELQKREAELKAKEHELQKREAEVVQKQLTESISEAVGHLRATADGLRSSSQGLQPTSDKLQSTSTKLESTTNDIHSAMKDLHLTATGLYLTSEGLQGIQSTSKEIQSAMQGLQSSSKTAGSQLEALERLASDLAKTAAADTSALQSQHKQEVDGLKSTISKLETKINAWESGHKERLADFDAKRQAAMTEIEQREQSLAKRKEELMSLEIEALRELHAAGVAAKHVEAQKQTALGAMSDLEERLQAWRIDIEDGITSLDEWGKAYTHMRTVTQEQTMRAKELCRELHTDIERFDDQIKSMEVRSGKLPEPRGDVWMTDEEGSIEERVTQPSTGKRAHQASSTSTGASPRKTAAKRAKPAGLSTTGSSPSADTLPRLPPPSSLATRWLTSRTLKGIGRSSLSKAPHDYSTATLHSRLPQRRPALGSDVFDPPAGQASNSFTRQSMSPSSGQGQAQATSSPAATEALAPQTGIQEDFPPLQSESEREPDVGPEEEEEEEEEVPEPSSAQSQIEIPTKIKLIWSQLTFRSKLTRKERTNLIQWMQKAEVKTRNGAKASYLLEKCAREERRGRTVCFTSCLRGKGGTNFFRGTNEPCNECRTAKIHVPCLRVKWVDDQARRQEDSAKRWIVDKR
ncbi:MAG: hypothetical protein LQ345_002589 [Seirophora villosa]|nr:MAG: hypothetical protein LQ345_002589 [Seirophora villosa]